MAITHDVMKNTAYKSPEVIEAAGYTVTLQIPDYRSIKLEELYRFVEACPLSWFGSKKIYNNTNLEALSYSLYGFSKYWDLIVILNYRSPLFDMPYDFDIVSDMVDANLDRYEKDVLGKKLSEKARSRLYKQFEEKEIVINENYRLIKYILPDHLYDFIIAGIKAGVLTKQ